MVFLAAPVFAAEDIKIDSPAKEETKVDCPADEVIKLGASEETNFTTRLVGGIDKFIKDEKVINFEKGPIDSFAVGATFQGLLNMHFTEQDPELRSNYPLFTEIWTRTRFENGKSEIRASFLPSRDLSGFDRKFNGAIFDLYYKRKLGKHHSIIIGNSRVPIGMDTVIHPSNTLFVKSAQMTAAYGNRSTGIRLQGDYGIVYYDVGGYFSTRFMQDWGEGYETVDRITIKPFNNHEGSVFQNLKFGAGVNYGRRGGDYTVSDVSASWDYKKWLVQAEYANANGSNGSVYNPKRSQSFYATLGYYITDKLQILGRYDVFDPDKTHSNDLITQYTAGLNYYVIGQRLKFALNYVLEQNQALQNNHKQYILFMTQVQI